MGKHKKERRRQRLLQQKQRRQAEPEPQQQQTERTPASMRAEVAEIARRRVVLGTRVSGMLSDAQILQLEDPGPELHSPAAQWRNEARLLQMLPAARRPKREQVSPSEKASIAAHLLDLTSGKESASALQKLPLRQLLALAEQLEVDEKALNDVKEKAEITALILAKVEGQGVEKSTQKLVGNIELVRAAISADDAVAVRSLLAANAKLDGSSETAKRPFDINAKLVDGETLLIHATKHCNRSSSISRKSMCDSVAALIEYNADVNMIDSEGSTALHWAISNDYTQVAHNLFDAGAKTGKCRCGVSDMANDQRCHACNMHGKRLHRAMVDGRRVQCIESKETFEDVLRDEFGDEPGDTCFLKELELAKTELGHSCRGGKDTTDTDHIVPSKSLPD